MSASLAYTMSNLSAVGNLTLAQLSIGKSNAGTYAFDVLGEINASSNIRIAGQSLQGLGVPNQVVFTSGSSTWTVPSGVTQIQVEAVGGGGGGSQCGNTNNCAGGGGGAGQYARFTLAVTPTTTISYTVGTGGGVGGSYNAAGSDGTATTVSYSTRSTTSTCNGGSGGGAAVAGTIAGTGGVGGFGGAISGTYYSYFSIDGGDGNGGTPPPTSNAGAGSAGASYFGGGTSTSSGKAYGSGGIGSVGGNLTATAGAPGVVIITYFTQSGLPTNYTATAPLSMTGTTLSIAAATSNAPGVVQVGSGLSVSSGVISLPQNYICFGINVATAVGTCAGSSSSSVIYMKQGPISIASTGIITCGAAGLYQVSLSSVGGTQGNVYVRYNGVALSTPSTSAVTNYGCCYLYGQVNAAMTVYVKCTSASDTIDFYQNAGAFQQAYASFNVIQIQ